MAVKVGDKKVFKGKLLKQADGKAVNEAGEFECSFATLNVKDHDGDVIPTGAVGEQRAFFSAWQHNHSEVPFGGGDIGERDGMAIMRGKLALSDDVELGPEIRRLHWLMNEFPDLFEFSFGFYVSSVEWRDGTPYLLGLDIFEVSAVYRGAGIDTHLISVKYLGHITATPEQYQSLKGPLTEMLNLTKERRASQ